MSFPLETRSSARNFEEKRRFPFMRCLILDMAVMLIDFWFLYCLFVLDLMSPQTFVFTLSSLFSGFLKS